MAEAHDARRNRARSQRGNAEGPGSVGRCGCRLQIGVATHAGTNPASGQRQRPATRQRQRGQPEAGIGQHATAVVVFCGAPLQRNAPARGAAGQQHAQRTGLGSAADAAAIAGSAGCWLGRCRGLEQDDAGWHVRHSVWCPRMRLSAEQRVRRRPIARPWRRPCGVKVHMTKFGPSRPLAGDVQQQGGSLVRITGVAGTRKVDQPIDSAADRCKR